MSLNFPRILISIVSYIVLNNSLNPTYVSFICIILPHRFIVHINLHKFYMSSMGYISIKFMTTFQCCIYGTLSVLPLLGFDIYMSLNFLEILISVLTDHTECSSVQGKADTQIAQISFHPRIGTRELRPRVVANSEYAILCPTSRFPTALPAHSSLKGLNFPPTNARVARSQLSYRVDYRRYCGNHPDRGL